MHDLVPSTSSFDTQFNTSGYTPLINRSKTAHAPAMEKNEIMEAAKQNGLTVWQTLFFGGVTICVTIALGRDHQFSKINMPSQQPYDPAFLIIYCRLLLQNNADCEKS